jgi:hypothetical protein
MRLSATVSLSVLALLAAGMWLSGTRTPDSRMANATESGIEQNQSDVQPGMRVYIDPVTGEFVNGPVEKSPVDLPEQLKSALSTSAEGLKVEPAPGGGIMVNLQGRFQHASIATIDAQGNVTSECETGEAAAAALDAEGEE